MLRNTVLIGTLVVVVLPLVSCANRNRSKPVVERLRVGTQPLRERGPSHFPGDACYGRPRGEIPPGTPEIHASVELTGVAPQSKLQLVMYGPLTPDGSGSCAGVTWAVGMKCHLRTGWLAWGSRSSGPPALNPGLRLLVARA